jgi:hypothetical protein
LNEEREEVVWARGIGWGLTDGDGMRRPAGERKGKRQREEEGEAGALGFGPGE